MTARVLCDFSYIPVFGTLYGYTGRLVSWEKNFYLIYCVVYEISFWERKINSILSVETCISKTKIWLEKAVIGLNLCPFAKAVHTRQQIRYVVSAASDIEALLFDLGQELQILENTPEDLIDTILLIHPKVLRNFLDYNDFLELADQLLERQGYLGTFQIASFHPEYQFAGTAADAIENHTNRSPFPMLHLLRESSIERAVDAFPDAAEIFEKNIDTMKRLGKSGWAALFDDDASAGSTLHSE